MSYCKIWRFAWWCLMKTTGVLVRISNTSQNVKSGSYCELSWQLFELRYFSSWMREGLLGVNFTSRAFLISNTVEWSRFRDVLDVFLWFIGHVFLHFSLLLFVFPSSSCMDSRKRRSDTGCRCDNIYIYIERRCVCVCVWKWEREREREHRDKRIVVAIICTSWCVQWIYMHQSPVLRSAFFFRRHGVRRRRTT